jgi:hypothetical protein
MGIVCKYPKSVPKYFQLHNTPSLWWLKEVTHHTYGGDDSGSHFVFELCECISNLVFGVDGEDLDKPLSHVFAKMMISNVYVLGPWA